MAHSYQLQIGEYTFSANDIKDIDEAVAVDLVGDALSVDVLNVTVFYIHSDAELFAPFGTRGIETRDGKLFATSRTYPQGRLTDAKRGEIVSFFIDGEKHAQYYLDEISRVGENSYEISCVSGIGLLDSIYFGGGMYEIASGVTFGEVFALMIGGSVGVAENNIVPIIGGIFDCSMEQRLSNQLISGRLPYDTVRENLHRMLLGYGATLTKTPDGGVLVTYLYNNENPEEISADYTYDEGKVVNTQPKSQVQITEHTYINNGTSDEVVTVYDASTSGIANHSLIKFEEPLHNLEGTGSVVIEESNCNYAIITGTGTLKGYKYIHTRKVITKGTSITKDNIVTLSDLELINPINSANILDRLYNYYTNATEIESDFVLQNQKCGRQYKFKDVFGDTRVGFLSKMDIESSGIRKANAKFICNYIPTSQGNKYSRSVLLTGSGTWEVPSGINAIKAILIGGGNGADGAYNGENGGTGSIHSSEYGYTFGGSQGGKGGAGTKAALGGKVVEIELDELTQRKFIYNCGKGGTGGARNGGKGQSGTDTIFGIYSSENGERLNGVINIFTGDVYARNGLRDGVNGANGGEFKSGDATVRAGEKGGDVDTQGTVYTGANGYTAHIGWEAVTDIPIYHTYSGGGASYGSSATNNNGASAKQFQAPKYGEGASGANGGGGGGAGGYRIDTDGWKVNYIEPLSGGSGGLSSEAQSGGDGCIIVYF